MGRFRNVTHANMVVVSMKPNLLGRL